jgi:hypothetical protein
VEANRWGVGGRPFSLQVLEQGVHYLQRNGAVLMDLLSHAAVAPRGKVF